MELFYKTGRFVYRQLGWSANQRINRTFSGRVKAAEASNHFIKEIILSGKPAMISRFGTPESKCLLNFTELLESREKAWFRKIDTKFKGSVNQWMPDVRKDLQDLVGFFPTTDEMLERFSRYYAGQIKKIDAVGLWGFVPGERFLIRRFCPDAIVYDPRALEPYYFEHPWSGALEGKKVLVIHPFTESIKKQYLRRENLFVNSEILPGFELKTIKAVQSIAGNKTPFQNWFEALDWMQGEIDKTDFDVAIIGAGSYGLPLSAYVKDRGKISIHIGGSTQILFGIKGKRWDDHPVISSFYNAHWVRPSADETVPQAQKVEDGCYW